MPIDPTSVGAKSEPTKRSWTSTDCLIYSLGVGVGQDDPAEGLAFTTENTKGVPQQVLPTFAVIVGWAMVPALGSFDLASLVHGGQAIEMHRALPAAGELEAITEIAAIYDKGTAAVVVLETHTTLVETGEPLFTTTSTQFFRGEGGWGGDRGPRAQDVSPPPDRAPDDSASYPIPIDQALLYRLSGDRNRLHTDPQFANRAGFPRPILQGLCTYGYAGRAVLRSLCGGDPGRFGSMSVRFAQPVFPGDTITIDLWIDGPTAVFQTRNQDGVVVLDAGIAQART